MKTKHILTLAFTLLTSIILQPATLFGQEVLKNTTIFFYSTTDQAGAVAFMTISFVGISDEESKKITGWQKEISDKLEKLGGVYEHKDYQKITEVIPDYVVQFVKTKAKIIFMEFPKRRTGVFLRKQDPLPPKPPTSPKQTV